MGLIEEGQGKLVAESHRRNGIRLERRGKRDLQAMSIDRVIRDLDIVN